MAETSTTRTFICIDFPDEIIKETARLQSLIKKQKFVGKLTELENLHLTLKFLGEISEDKLSQVKSLLKEVKFSPFSAFLEYSGTFSRFNNPSIVWIKVGGSNIAELQRKIDESLNSIFKKEPRFMSH